MPFSKVASAGSAARALALLCVCTWTTLAWATPASRVVTLVPSLAEIASEVLGPKELSRIVGVSEYTNSPAELKNRMSVGPYSQPSRERILSLKPDLVLATQDGTPKALVEALKRDGIRVVHVKGDSLQDVVDSFVTVGDALGFPLKGREVRTRWVQSLDAIRKSSARCSKKRVMLQFEAGPRDPLIVVGARNFVNDAVDLLGAVNVFADPTAAERYPRPSVEEVVRKDPDMIIVLALTPDRAPSAHKNTRDYWKRYSKLRAPKLPDGIRVQVGDEIQRPGPRLIEGIRALKHVIHGESC